MEHEELWDVVTELDKKNLALTRRIIALEGALLRVGKLIDNLEEHYAHSVPDLRPVVAEGS